ncbi:MAG: ankyrin repeat domain-containing protein [bacterium]|nr:ankyrin repeat domain-containing protein [bacterium]
MKQLQAKQILLDIPSKINYKKPMTTEEKEEKDAANKLLIQASIEGNLADIKKSLEAGADLEFNLRYGDDCGMTALMLACRGGDLETARFLVEKGARVYAGQLDYSYLLGTTPLMFALENGSRELIEFLVEKEASVNSGNKRETVLMRAAERGDPEILKLLIQNGADVNRFGDMNKTPLMAACKKGHFEAARILVENNAHVNAENLYRYTVLMSAAGSGCLELVEFLVNHGAEISGFSKYGRTVFTEAAQSGNLDCLKYCLDTAAACKLLNEDYLSTLLLESGSLEAARYLVEEMGANIEEKDYGGTTALMLAAHRNKLDIVSYLVEHGADITLQEQDQAGELGKTALMFAADRGNLEIVQYLVSLGADSAPKNKYGESAIALAVANNHTAVVDFLSGGDKKDSGDLLAEALLTAAVKGNLEMVTHLVEEKNAPVNCADSSGKSPLMSAAENEELTVVKYLVEKGADVFKKTASGKTAIDFVDEEPPEHHENGYEAWCHSNAGPIRSFLKKKMRQ